MSPLDLRPFVREDKGSSPNVTIYLVITGVSGVNLQAQPVSTQF